MSEYYTRHLTRVVIQAAGRALSIIILQIRARWVILSGLAGMEKTGLLDITVTSMQWWLSVSLHQSFQRSRFYLSQSACRALVGSFRTWLCEDFHCSAELWVSQAHRHTFFTQNCHTNRDLNSCYDKPCERCSSMPAGAC